jgi:hypothetical protein
VHVTINLRARTAELKIAAAAANDYRPADALAALKPFAQQISRNTGDKTAALEATGEVAMPRFKRASDGCTRRKMRSPGRLSTPACKSNAAIRKALGSAGQTKTPTACCANTSPETTPSFCRPRWRIT